MTRTLASATITVVSDRGNGFVEGNGSARSFSRAVKDLVHGRLICLVDQPGAQVLLQGLVRCGGTLSQYRMCSLRYILDLDASHGSILAPVAPKCKRWSPLHRHVQDAPRTAAAQGMPAVVVDAAGDIVVQSETDDAVVTGVERPGRAFAEDVAECVDSRFP
jgi:hypothetical protein